jgi:S-adenosylmethionine:tRNA ribosyltransferase-isomerase
MDCRVKPGNDGLNMRTDLFDFELPADRIALRPASPRDSARMLIVQPGSALDDRVVADLPLLLQPGDQLVVNDTKVIPAQLKGRRIGRETEPKIEATLIKRLDGSRWQALVKPAKKLLPGDVVRFGNEGKVCLLGHLDAQVEQKGEDGEVTLSFSFHGPALDAAIADLGSPPLPPYIASKRAPDERDASDYQTMFAATEGAVAAPTAGLHFTPALEAALHQRGIGISRITLHVGAGTFLPVKAEDTAAHKMHAEWGTISRETSEALNAARARGGRIVAVGTTSLRLLESAATDDGTIRPFAGETAIFITPGYRFRAVLRARHHETGLCPCHRQGLPVLLVWRCVFAVSRLMRRVGKGALAPCPPVSASLSDGGHASAFAS